jgi:hypothetical protein
MATQQTTLSEKIGRRVKSENLTNDSIDKDSIMREKVVV